VLLSRAVRFASVSEEVKSGEGSKLKSMKARCIENWPFLFLYEKH
jgi:hypothetical protein